MQRRDLFFVAAITVLTTVFVCGCGRPKSETKVLAQIGDVKITVGDFNERISNLPANYQDIINKKRKEFLQELVNDTLLYREAVKKGFDKDKDVIKVVEEARKKILIARLLKDDIDDTIKVSDEEIKEYYETNKSNFTLPEVIRVSQILVPTREDADVVIQDLKKGGSFAEIAKARSIDPTAANGGDIGYFIMGQLIPEFENACVGLSVDGIAGPIKTKLGYHVIKLTDRKDPAVKNFDEVKENIKTLLHNKKRRDKFNSLLKDLTKKTKISIDEKVLQEMENPVK